MKDHWACAGGLVQHHSLSSPVSGGMCRGLQHRSLSRPISGFSLQQSRMRLGNPLACHAFRLPRCRPHAAAQHKPQMVAESGNMKMQPEPDYDADQALTDAGFTPRQARSLVKFMGNVVQPLALESSVLKLETSLKALDFKLSLLLIYFRVEVAANPNVWGWLQPLP